MSSTPYNRQNSFALFSAENPTSQQSGIDLDAEFNAVKISLDDTQQNLAKIQDADGVLKRGSVGRAQFDSSVSLGFAAPAQWASGVLYTANISTVFYNSIFYVANVTHTSSAFDPAKWDKIADFTAAAAIPDGSITSAKLADGAVAANKLADGVVSNSKLATGSVTSNKIADQNVTYGKLDPTMGALLANLVLPAGLGPIPWSVPALPVGWDWADGGVLLSNTSYPALRQRYIDAGYPHGQDGSGNPKKPDMRGRVPIGWDTMAGSPANRITTAGCGIDGSTIGATGGVQTAVIAQANMPNVSLPVAGTVVVAGNQLVASGTPQTVNLGSAGSLLDAFIQGTATRFTPTASSANSGGSVSLNTGSINGNVAQTAMNNAQPGLVCGMIIKAH